VAEHLAQHHGRNVDLKIHGIPDVYVDHGTQQELWADLQLDVPGIVHVVKDFLSESVVRRALS